MIPIRFITFAALVAMLPLVAWADELPTPAVEFGAKKIDLPTGETTQGTAKLEYDLPGTWLVCENHDLKGDRFFPGLQMYRVEKGEQGKLEVHLLNWSAPEPIATAVKKAQQAQVVWWPSEQEVKLVAAEMKAKPGVVDPKRRGKHVVSAAKDFVPEIVQTPASKGASFAIQSLFQPEDRPAYGQSYFVKKEMPNELSGDFTLGAVPQAKGLPIPIGTTGVFRWIRMPAS